MVQLWDSIIQRNDRNLHQCDLVCSLHFKEEDIERYYTHIIDGQVVRIERGNPKLRKGAVPSVFSCDNLKGLRATRRSRALAQRRSLEKKRKLTAGDYAVGTSTHFKKGVTISRHDRASIQIKEEQNSDSEERPNPALTEGMKSPLFEVFNTSDHCRTELYGLLAGNKTEASAEIKKTLSCRSDFEFPISLAEETTKITGNRIPETMLCRPNEPNEVDTAKLRVSAFTYSELLEYAYVIPLPSSLWAVHKQPRDKYVAFVHMTYSTVDGFKTDRGVVFEETCEPVIFFYSHRVRLPQLEKKVTCVGDVSNLLQEVDEFHAVCLFVDCVK
ncbi:hypothetical protein B7P43_G10668 [Cryptotermes secundus]|nr:uncharacterized protein LOC111863229 isoform X2 [Cryptotermes secundus]PNF36156.1 hypothetical protein B7P43_G10668 [Cryptotermes secundus]